MPTRDIAFLLWPEYQMLDVSGPLEAFSIANNFAAGAYRTHLIARDEGTRSSSGLSLGPNFSLTQAADQDWDTLLIPGGRGIHSARKDKELLSWIMQAQMRVRRLCSVCSGVFLLAETGILSSKRAATHWESVPRLSKEFPDIQVEPDAIYCRDGEIWTSAGVTAGMDLALALIEEDHGRAIALSVAREMVLFLKRPGGQSQFSVELLAQEKAGSRFDDFLAWLFANLDHPLDIESMADYAAMSRRSFQRRFSEAFGTTPAKFVEKARLDAARRDLENSNQSIERIADSRGFGDAERMRRAFQRHLGLPPAEYRERFHASPSKNTKERISK